jgi:hypothetical protein
MTATAQTVSVNFDGQTFTRIRHRDFTFAVCCKSQKHGGFVCSWHVSEAAALKTRQARAADKFDPAGPGSEYFVVATS